MKLNVRQCIRLSSALCLAVAAIFLLVAHFVPEKWAYVCVFVAGWYARTARIHVEREPFMPLTQAEKKEMGDLASRN